MALKVRKKTLAPDVPSLFGDAALSPTSKTAAGTPASEYVERNRERIRRWSSKGVLFGSSSWKYPGWKGQVYTRAYPSQKAFERECLAEYSELFPTVSADFALYDFPVA